MDYVVGFEARRYATSKS